MRGAREASPCGSTRRPRRTWAEGERVWAVGLQVEEESPTVFARGFGVEGISVASHRVMTAVPLCGGPRVASR